MKIVVCIKQVPSSNNVRLDPETKTIIRDGRQSVINPFDLYAVEQAAQIKNKLGGKVLAISMGIPDTKSLLQDTMARGADEAYLLNDRYFAGADTLATSYTLSLGIKKWGGFDLILCGKMAVDGDTAQIGPELAEQLGIPHVTDVNEILSVTEKEIVCRKLTDEGNVVLRVKLPALLTVVKDIVMPKMPSIAGVRASLKKEVQCFTAESLMADVQRIGLNGSPTQVVKTYLPQREKQIEWIPGESREQAETIINLIKEVQ